MRPAALVLVLLLLAPGCAFRQKKVLYTLDHPAPVNCATAEGDLRVLQSEKTHVGERIAEGATAIYPAGLILGVVTWTEPTKIEVAIGKYDDKLDERMALIEKTCGISAPPAASH